MSLLDLWQESPDELRDKHVHQVIAFAGDGKLKDGSVACTEFREFLAAVPSRSLNGYVDHCLTQKFENSGLALQDVVNEVGARLGFEVQPGRYRGTAGAIGHDGLWIAPEGHALVVEVKTTDAYAIQGNRPRRFSRHPLRSSSVFTIVHESGPGMCCSARWSTFPPCSSFG